MTHKQLFESNYEIKISSKLKINEKDGLKIGHWPRDKNEKFSDVIFYFLQADRHTSCGVCFLGKLANFADGDQRTEEEDLHG